jgi:hypothetical protein
LELHAVAKKIVRDFGPKVNDYYVKFFADNGFNSSNILDCEVLFRFLVLVSYDMQAHARLTWKSDMGKDSIQAKFENFLTLDTVRSCNTEADLEEILQRHSLPKMTGRVNHSKGIFDLARNIPSLCNIIQNVKSDADIRNFHDLFYKNENEKIAGFGPTLSAKVILYIVRCFGIGLGKTSPQTLRIFANDLFGERWVQRRGKCLEKAGLKPDELIDALTELGDPYSIDLLYSHETGTVGEKDDCAKFIDYLRSPNLIG